MNLYGKTYDMMWVVWAVMGSVMFGAYLVCDLIVIMSPKSTDFDEYILGSLLIYMDIVRMFTYLLFVLSDMKKH